MKVNVKPINGNWDLGYSLDKHVLKRVYIGEDEWGHSAFDTTRSEAGEALFQLKYRFDYKQILIISSQMFDSFSGYFSTANFIIPIPPSKARTRQPVIEISQQLASKMQIPYLVDLLVKTKKTPQMKDIDSRDDKVKVLVDAFSINDQLEDGLYDIIVVDDLYDTGSSLEAASTVLRGFGKIRTIYIATVTRTR